MQKGGYEGEARVLYGQREGEGEVEGEWRPVALALMADGQSSARNKRRGKTSRNGGDFIVGELLP